MRRERGVEGECGELRCGDVGGEEEMREEGGMRRGTGGEGSEEVVGGKGRWGGEKGKVRTNTLSHMGLHYLSSLVPRPLRPFFLG